MILFRNLWRRLTGTCIQQWDLNTGTVVRRYAGHGPQLTSLAVRPLDFDYPVAPPPITSAPATSSARERRERAAEVLFEGGDVELVG